MIWVRYGGIVAGAILALVGAAIVIAPMLRTRQHAKAIVPTALLAKFRKAQDDLGRVQGATVLLEELVARTRDAVDRLNAAIQTLRAILPSR